MCGIAGVSWSNPHRMPDFDEIRRMVNVLAHRGPDDSGLYHSDSGLFPEFDSACRSSPPQNWPGSGGTAPGLSSSGAVLGHRRLSIIDLGGGHQPLSNEDGSVWVAFNGEIYNYRELRDELIACGHKFRTDSDTEVIVHLYEERGDNFVDSLRGMFAFAIWEKPRRRLVLVRDRIGQKPLFYRLANGRLDFASELKSLLQLADAPRELNLAAVDNYLTYQYVPHPQSILQGYSKLPPGHLAVFENGQLETRRYWQAPFDTEAGDREKSGRAVSRSEVRDKLRRQLTEAVRLRMRSDVPLGAFLSGGIDSTIIVGLMQELAEQPVHTFSIGFPVARFDERSFARDASQHLGTIHHEQVVKPSALSILPKLIWHYDEPFADSSAIPTMLLSEMTRRHVTVALSGDGGDELFAGYNRYRAVRLGARFDRLPAPVRKAITSRLWQRLPASVEQKSKRRQLKRLLDALGDEPISRYLRWVSIFDQSRRSSLFSADATQQLVGHRAASFLESCYSACPNRDFVSRTTCADMLSYLPCDILTKVDIASMAVGLECRSPFLDHHVAEAAAVMPIKMKLRGPQGKHILIETFRDLLPPSIRKRPKMGFGVPLDHWFRDELKPLLHEILLGERALNRGLFRPDIVRNLVAEHSQRKWDHSARLWSLLVLELWQQTWLDAPIAPASPSAVE
jgi:asparagine synthase (glutamine-hydrolysing)